MMDWIFDELRFKASLFEKENLVTAFDIGVVKSDAAIPEQLKQLLKEAVVPFEDVPEEERDYHPGSDGSDGKVVDLMHPSLFPVVYGRTHILGDRMIGLNDCFKSTGEGEQLPSPPKQEKAKYSSISASHKSYTQKSQWLPCDVKFIDEEPGCRIMSYINNLHPVKPRDLYGVLGKVTARAIPLWNRSLRLPIPCYGKRLGLHAVESPGHPNPESVRQEGEDNRPDEQRHRDSPDFITSWCHPPYYREQERCVDLWAMFMGGGLQVIVRLANIELTPEKPDFAGGQGV